MLHAQFVKKFKKHFDGGWVDRWTAFDYIAKKCEELGRPVTIVETGCLREPGNWWDDGQSTALFGWLASKTKGTVLSIDYAKESLDAAVATVPNAVPVQMDSILALRNIGDAENIDILYLDSMDRTDRWDSPLHHIGELASIYSRLKSGCLIAVDDCVGPYGKHRYVSMFFSDIGVLPKVVSHIIVWEKP